LQTRFGERCISVVKEELVPDECCMVWKTK